MPDSLQPHGQYPPDSFVHGISQIRMLEWVAISYSRGSSWPRNQTNVSCTAGGFFIAWATREGFLYDDMNFIYWFQEKLSHGCRSALSVMNFIYWFQEKLSHGCRSALSVSAPWELLLLPRTSSSIHRGVRCLLCFRFKTNRKRYWGIPGGSLEKSPAASAEDCQRGSVPGVGRPRTPQNN